ncbi:MAG: methylated-DNA--[protein]-cysteine S-methyltransferase [Micrococcales bacterium]|nr:methylated-DNA--[protein]-cysteine S-methyltransferase [Micrococcales bacterium]
MAYCDYKSPIGTLTLVANDAGLRAVWWPDDPRATLTGEDDPDHPVLRQAVEELDEYFAGLRTTFDVPLDPVGTDFQLAAWDILRGIPYGRTITYGEQATRLGDPRKARAVGAANGRNPLSIVVPCHRVVGSTGTLTGFAGGIDTKQWLLDFERAHAA